MKELKIKYIPIYNDIYLLIMDLLYKYSLLHFCNIHINEEYETFEFIDEGKKRVYFCIDIGLNIDIECRITFLYGIENPSNNKKHHREFSDTYIYDKNQVETIKNTILTFISNKVIIREFYLKNKIIWNNLNYYYYNKGKIKYIEDNSTSSFILPWQKKNIVEKVYEFEPWIESEFTLKG